jgi:hypothetical protein
MVQCGLTAIGISGLQSRRRFERKFLVGYAELWSRKMIAGSRLMATGSNEQDLLQIQRSKGQIQGGRFGHIKKIDANLA